MPFPIINKRSTTPDAIPQANDLQAGEIAINAADGAVFIKTTAAEVVDLMNYTFADGGEITAPGTNP
jgi:hypothetical protein